MNTDCELLTAKDVAKLLRVSERSVWAWSASGILPPPLKLGRIARWRRGDIAKALDRLAGGGEGVVR